MELFEFLNILIERPAEWKDIAPGEKRKQFFMMQRRLAINFPAQANALQHLKINQSAVADFWHSFIRVTNRITKTPGWMYTKGLVKSQKEKEKKLDVSEKLILQFAKFNKIDVKSVKDALGLFPEAMVKELKTFEKTSIPK